MDIALLVSQVNKYAASAYDDGLEDLQKSFETLQAAEVVLDDIIPVDEIQACVTKFVHAIRLRPQRLLEWSCLCLLSDQQRYNRAADIIAILAESLECKPLLVHCGTIISARCVCDELRFCFLFLVQFMESCDPRREMVYNIAPLREALFDYLLKRFNGAVCEVQTLALSGAESLVVRFYNGSRDNDGISLLRDGALVAVKEAALHVFSFGARSGAQWTMQQTQLVAINALLYTLGTISRIPVEQLATLDKSMYALSRNEVFRFSVIIYEAATSVGMKQRHCRVDVFLVEYGDYLLRVLGAEALRSYLLYKPPRVAGATPIAVLMAEFIIRSDEAWMENYVLISLNRFAEAVPEVAEVLSALPPPPQRVAKDRHCAFPACSVVGTGLHINLKKCTRCKAVNYCSKEHQNVHWPEHKSTCVKATSLVGEGQSADK
jgi:hypothetical protein